MAISYSLVADQDPLMPVPSSTSPTVPKLQVNPRTHCNWIFDTPPNHLKHRKILLLTIMGVGVHAVWTGQLGAYYSGYDASAS